MKVGLTTFVTDRSMRPDELAREAETRGFESLFLPEHTHIPVSRESPYPSGGELPDWYARGLDPMVALAIAAGATTTIRLGTAVCLVSERDPIVLAKEVASLDLLSNGRVVLGVGAGWNREEMANHGTDPRLRWTTVRERVAAMRVIWNEVEAEYHGRTVDFDPIWSWPKPQQAGGPPILIGGRGPAAIARVVEYGDGWIPPIGWIDDVAGQIGELRAAERSAGVGPRPVTLVGVKPRRDVIAQYADVGVERVVIAVPEGDRETVLPLLDRYAGVLS